MTLSAASGYRHSLWPGGFRGDQLVFQAELADGSQALYAATIGGTRCPLSHGYGKYVRDRDITQYERYMLPPPRVFVLSNTI